MKHFAVLRNLLKWQTLLTIFVSLVILVAIYPELNNTNRNALSPAPGNLSSSYSGNVALSVPSKAIDKLKLFVAESNTNDTTGKKVSADDPIVSVPIQESIPNSQICLLSANLQIIHTSLYRAWRFLDIPPPQFILSC